MGGHPPPMYGGPAPPGPPAYGGLAELRQFREELEKQMKDHKEEQEKVRRDLEAASNVLTQQMERMNLAAGGSPSPGPSMAVLQLPKGVSWDGGRGASILANLNFLMAVFVGRQKIVFVLFGHVLLPTAVPLSKSINTKFHFFIPSL